MEGVDGGPSEGGASGGSDDQPQPRKTEANVRGRGPAGGDRAEPALPSPPVTSPQPKRSMCWSSGHPAATASSLPVVTSPQPPRLRCWRSKLARSDSSRRDNNTAELYSLFFILYSLFFILYSFYSLFFLFRFFSPCLSFSRSQRARARASRHPRSRRATLAGMAPMPGRSGKSSCWPSR